MSNNLAEDEASEALLSPNAVIFALGACTMLKDLEAGKKIHTRKIESGISCNNIDEVLMGLYT